MFQITTSFEISAKFLKTMTNGFYFLSEYQSFCHTQRTVRMHLVCIARKAMHATLFSCYLILDESHSDGSKIIELWGGSMMHCLDL